MVYSGVKTQLGVIETVFLIVGHVISENEKLKKKKKSCTGIETQGSLLKKSILYNME